MIEFKGELRGEGKRYFTKKMVASTCFISGLVALFIAVPVIILGVLFNPIILIGLIAVVLFPLIFLLIPWYYATKSLPNRIEIDEDGLLMEMKNERHLRDIRDVKYVRDYGEYYDIEFYFPHKSACFICQKDLLSKGRLEDFEKLFQSKIKKEGLNAHR